MVHQQFTPRRAGLSPAPPHLLPTSTGTRARLSLSRQRHQEWSLPKENHQGQGLWWRHHKPAPGCVPVPPHQQDTCWEILLVQRPKGLSMWLSAVWGRLCSLPLPQGLHPISIPPSSPLGCDKSCGSLSKSTLYICCLELLQPWTMNSC